jgi:hypothetical protein
MVAPEVISEQPLMDEGLAMPVEEPSDFTSEKAATTPTQPAQTKPAPPTIPESAPEPAPTEPSAAPEPSEDLMEPPAAQPEGQPAQPQPATEEPAAEQGTDEMLQQPATEEPAAPNGEEDELDDLFGTLDVRKWIDDTGRYSTMGRLAAISPNAIRILKNNGRFCTVTYDRLSSADFDYVQAIVKRTGRPSPVHVASAQ